MQSDSSISKAKKEMFMSDCSDTNLINYRIIKTKRFMSGSAKNSAINCDVPNTATIELNYSVSHILTNTASVF